MGFEAHANAPVEPRDLVLYALAVGATDLDHVYEQRGPVPLATWLSAVAFQHSLPLFERLGASESSAVFGETAIDAQPFLAPSAVQVTARVAGVYGLGALGIADLRHTVTDQAGTMLGQVTFRVFFADAAPVHAPHPPRAPRPLRPTSPPDWQVDLPTRPDQALLYRLCGDLNPLHIDPDVAATLPFTGGRPILHGLCTLGFVARAVEIGTGQRLIALSARFARPVWPGDTLQVSGWATPSGLVLRVRTRESGDEDVLTAVLARTGT